MSVDHRELKEFAEQLAVSGSSEVALRTSASRAYYAAFHALLPFIATLPKSAKCPNRAINITHQEVMERLDEWRVTEIYPSLDRLTATKGQVRRLLDAARAIRVKADYRLGGDFTLNEAQGQIERVGRIIRHSLQISGEVARTTNAA